MDPRPCSTGRFRHRIAPLVSCLSLALAVSCSEPERQSEAPPPPEPPSNREKPPPPAEKKEAEISFPVSRTLRDRSGRDVDATILGRDVDSITIVRLADGQRFVIPFSHLSSRDLEFCRTLPLLPAPAGAEPEAPPEPPYIANRLAEIERLRAEIEEFDQKLLSNAGNRIMTNSLHRDRDRARAEIVELEEQIRDYRERNAP